MRIYILLFLLVIFQLSFAQRRVYETSRFEGSAPKIDGIADEPAWDVVPWAGDFIQWIPANGAPPSQRTKFKIIYDDNYLYVAIMAHDSVPGDIVQRMSRRDGFEGDFVEINIDSYHDYLTAYSFSATAAGVKGDERITLNGQFWDATWDPIWYLKTTVNENGYLAEIKIPLTQLRFSAEKEQVWGLEVKRRYFKKDERSVWQPIPESSTGYVSLFGELRGLSNLLPKKQFEITPYVVGSYEHYKAEEGSPFHKGEEWKPRVGVDTKIGLTNNLTLDLTINPDFGQVEADPSEVNLTAFESYFEEQRPFFIEGRNIYTYGMEPGDDSYDGLFYSRRIGKAPSYEPDYDYVKAPENTAILGAAKITGKTKNGLSIGILESLTKKESAQVMNEGSDIEKMVVEPMTNYFVARVDQELNQGNTIVGGMVTSTERFNNDNHLTELPNAAQTVGLNMEHSWANKKYTVAAKFFGSRVTGDTASILSLQTASSRYFQRPDAKTMRLDSTRKSLNGTGGFVSFGRTVNSGWNFLTWVNWHSPQLELNDIGYMRNANDIHHIFWIGYRGSQPKGIFRNRNFNMAEWTGYNFDGVFKYWGLSANAKVKFMNYWELGIGTNYDGQAHSQTMLRGGPILTIPSNMNYWINLETDERKKLDFELLFFQTFGFQRNMQVTDGALEITFRPSDRWEISLKPSINLNHNKMQYLTTETFESKDRYFMAELNQKTVVLEFRVNLSLTPDLSLQYYGQPFISSGTYSNYKWITNPKANRIEEQYQPVFPNANFEVDLNEDGNSDITLGNPDFKYVFFQSNMVLRWEYLPGSTIYLVWSQSRNDGDYEPSQLPFAFDEDMNRMFAIFPHDVFLVKLSYRIPL
jgi:hypothetical protein